LELGPLYHWSPRDRLASIKRLGLVPGKRNFRGPTYHGSPENPNADNEDIGAGEYLQDSVSFSPDPATAWNYSHAVWRSQGTFDLWQVYLVKEDEVHVVSMWGGRLVEVRVRNRIKKARLIWVGERSVPPKGVAIETGNSPRT